LAKEALRKIPGYLSLARKYDLCEFDDQEEHDLEIYFSETEKEWKRSMVQTNRDIAEWSKTIPQEFKKDCGNRYLDILKNNCMAVYGKYIQAYQFNFCRESLKEEMSIILEKIKKIQMSISYSGLQKKGGITDEMIEKAKTYPIENLLEINERNFALCPFHDDKKPSLYCKGNFYYCFSCQSSGSVIDLYMHLHSCNFVEAIKNLNK